MELAKTSTRKIVKMMNGIEPPRTSWGHWKRAESNWKELEQDKTSKKQQSKY